MYTKGRCKKGQSQPLFSGAQGQNQRQWTQTETQDIPPEHQETLLYCEGDGALHRLLTVVVENILRNTLKPSGHSPGQLAPGGTS